MTRRASPFDALLGLAPPAPLPETTSATVVISGQRVTDASQLDRLLGEDDPLRVKLRHAMACRDSSARKAHDRGDKTKNRASQRAWYQANRLAILERQRAWYEANRDTALAKQRARRAAVRATTQPLTPPNERTDA